MCLYVSKVCAEGILLSFPWRLRNVKDGSEIAFFFFQMDAVLNYLNYTKKTQFCM